MKKIISLFQRNYDGDRLVRDEIVPGAEWVANGEGIATRKWDGTCCMIRGGKLFKRYDAKAFTIGNDGQKQPWNRTPPEGWEPAQEPDEATGHWPGWLAVSDKPEDQWHRQAFANMNFTVGHPEGDKDIRLPDGTYELCGPKVQSNPEREYVESEVGLGMHVLIPHGRCLLAAPRDFNELKAWLATQDIEGVVWHHPDGRMVKIKTRDFGLKRHKPEAVEA